jgi:hypothetical protein
VWHSVETLARVHDGFPTMGVKQMNKSLLDQSLGFSNVYVLLFQVSEFNPLTFTSVIECEKPNNDLSRFRGYM